MKRHIAGHQSPIQGAVSPGLERILRLERRAAGRRSRRLLGFCAVVAMAGVPAASGAQTPPVEHPSAEHLDRWPWRSGDVTVAIDRDGECYLDSGAGDVRHVPRGDVERVLARTLDAWDGSRFFFLAVDRSTEYGAVRSLLDVAYRAGIRVAAVIAGEPEEPRFRAGMDLTLRTEADTLVGARGELRENVTTIPRLFASPYAILLQLSEDGSYGINGEPVDRQRLPDRLDEIFREPVPSALFLDAAEHRPFQDVVTAMDAARGAGVSRIVVWVASRERIRAMRSGIAPRDSVGASPWRYLASDAVVDEVPQRLSCPVAVYPKSLQEAGIEGAVTLRFVVERDGGVLAETVEIVQASHAEFEVSSRAMIVGCRFQPGMVRRHAVRTLAEFPVVFHLQTPPPDSGAGRPPRGPRLGPDAGRR